MNLSAGRGVVRDEPDGRFEVVVTNPPFGKKSSITVVNEEGERDREALTYNRPDFWTTTSNKQLNFVQHVARDKVSLDLYGANLPDPNVLAQEIADDLRSALGQIEDIPGDLEQRVKERPPAVRESADG